jgi:tripartite-type tricarboxylate transporter receptor subunit TctC
MCREKGKLLLSLLFALIMVIAMVPQVCSQEKYPTKAIDLIVPFVPGGASDINARIVADFVKKKWGVPINVINKGGGASVPGNLEVYQAKPDGYTLLGDAQSSCSLLELAIKDLPFKIMDRTFIAMVSVSPTVFVTSPSHPWRTLKDLEAEVRKDPAGFTWGSLGAGAGDYAARQFFKAIGIDVAKTKPVVCRGGAEVVSLTAGGHIKLGLTSAAASYSHAKAGTMRALGITGFRLPESYPDLPTAEEQGYPTVNQVWWFGISGPPKLPSHIVSKWNEALQEMMKDPKYIARAKELLSVPFYRNSPDAREHVRKDMEEAGRLWGMR